MSNNGMVNAPSIEGVVSSALFSIPVSIVQLVKAIKALKRKGKGSPGGVNTTSQRTLNKVSKNFAASANRPNHDILVNNIGTNITLGGLDECYVKNIVSPVTHVGVFDNYSDNGRAAIESQVTSVRLYGSAKFYAIPYLVIGEEGLEFTAGGSISQNVIAAINGVIGEGKEFQVITYEAVQARKREDEYLANITINTTDIAKAYADILSNQEIQALKAIPASNIGFVIYSDVTEQIFIEGWQVTKGFQIQTPISAFFN